MTTYTPRHRRDIDPASAARCRCKDLTFCPQDQPEVYAAYESKHYGQPEAEVA